MNKPHIDREDKAKGVTSDFNMAIMFHHSARRAAYNAVIY